MVFTSRKHSGTGKRGKWRHRKVRSVQLGRPNISTDGPTRYEYTGYILDCDTKSKADIAKIKSFINQDTLHTVCDMPCFNEPLATHALQRTPSATHTSRRYLLTNIYAEFRRSGISPECQRSMSSIFIDLPFDMQASALCGGFFFSVQCFFL